MYRYLLMVVLVVVLSGCGMTQAERAEHETRRAEAMALQQRAAAEQASAEAQRAMYENETKRFDILADAVGPVYWPIILTSAMFLVALFVLVRMMLRAQMQQVAMLASRPHAEPRRLLPGDVGFEAAMLENYGGDWVRRQGQYYLRDGTRVTALIEQRG